MDRFWRSGYCGTSLDDLCAATGLSRSSLYAAFGDKHVLYLTALDLYWQLAMSAMREALADPRQSMGEALMRIYDGQLSLYFSKEGLPRGCFGAASATTEAVDDPEIGKSLAKGFRSLDAGFEALFEMARDRGELNPADDPAALAMLASATLNSIAVRARAGVPRAVLREIARGTVSVICGRLASTPVAAGRFGAQI